MTDQPKITPDPIEPEPPWWGWNMMQRTGVLTLRL